jgi:hypothetical protein
MWAKCKICGGEVVFDAWAYLDGTTHVTFDNNMCTECGFHDVDYEEVEDDYGQEEVHDFITP